MSTRPELWLLLYMLSGFVVLLLAISTFFSLGGFLLRPWFEKQERMLHVLPTEQYLTVFAWPIAQVVVFAVITGLGVTWLVAGGLTTLTGIAVLVVVAVGGIYTGLRAAERLTEVRRSDPIELACSDNPAAMRWASAELTRSVNALKADMRIADVKKLRSEHKKLHQLHDVLGGRLKELRRCEPGQQHMVVWSRELASGYTGLVSLGALTAVILAVAATGALVVARGDVIRAAGLGALLTVSAVGLWWAGMWLRAKTHANRTEALSEQLTAELDSVRCALDEVDQFIRDEIRQLAHESEFGVSRPTPPMPYLPRLQHKISRLLGKFWRACRRSAGTATRSQSRTSCGNAEECSRADRPQNHNPELDQGVQRRVAADERTRPDTTTGQAQQL